MSTTDWLTFAGLILGIVVACCGGGSWLLGRIDRGDKGVRDMVAQAEATWGATLGKSDLDFVQFKERLDTEFVRRREYEIHQRNTDRRLESIEAKLDKIPETLDRQSERLIAVLKEMRD